MPQIIEYQGEATIAVDGLFKELLDPKQWSPGDWYVEVTTEDNQVDGRLLYFDQSNRRGVVTIQPFDIEVEINTGPPVRIDTEVITKVVVP